MVFLLGFEGVLGCEYSVVLGCIWGGERSLGVEVSRCRSCMVGEVGGWAIRRFGVLVFRGRGGFGCCFFW